MLTNVLHNKGVKYEHYSEIKYANKTTNQNNENTI